MSAGYCNTALASPHWCAYCAKGDSWADIDGEYRYSLGRQWGDGPHALWIMLNPSTADAEQDDPTIRRCRAFSIREDCGGMVVVNLYAYRATDPKDLRVATDAIGPRNKSELQAALAGTRGGPVIAAWGAGVEKVTQPSRRSLRHRVGPTRLNVEQFARDERRRLMCLGTTKAGHPRHPLYVKADAGLVELRLDQSEPTRDSERPT